MVTKEEVVKTKIQELVNDFRINHDKYVKGSEADTETKLIEPLFEALGWTKADFDKRPPTRREGKRGIADYAFKIGDKTVFYLEAKKVGIPLEKEADKQVISYALSKRPTIPFAISTNFEELKIFCVEQENALHQTFRSFNKPENYITDIQSLLWLSKENFGSGATLQKAEEEGRLKKRISIDKVLLEDLMQMRKLLVDDIEKKYSQYYDLNEKEEIVQRIIDRLIFIRRCEDIEINPKNMTLREITELPHDEAHPKLKTYFKEYNEVYNSGLFAVGIDNDCDKIELNGAIIKKLIECLYESKDKQYYYNFDWIDADVLGQVYEQYLGKILQQTKSGKAKLKEGQAHRKESGIYYTPTYIVDFILKNTLCEVLKDKKIKAKDLKILDPACGSGSFLIKAFDYLYADLSTKKDAGQHKFDNQGSYSIKTDILKKNIYAVDLDNKAVEITKLNLLLKAAEKFRKLPEEVDLHIKQGNSLIDDNQIAGFATFNWKEKFPNLIDFDENGILMSGTGFDIIVGNPPYLSFYSRQSVLGSYQKEVDWLRKNYAFTNKNIPGRLNSVMFFLERAISLLKEKGYLGFIIDANFLENPFINIRKYIFTTCKILLVSEKISSFEGVNSDQIVIVVQKESDSSKRDNNLISFVSISNKKNIGSIKQDVLKIDKYELANTLDEYKISKVKSQFLRELYDTTTGIQIGIGGTRTYKGKLIEQLFFSNTKKQDWLPVISLDKKYLYPYSPTTINKYLNFNETLGYEINKNVKKCNIAIPKYKNYIHVPKLIVRQSSDSIVATYAEGGYVAEYSSFSIKQNFHEWDLFFLLGLLNSKFITYYARKNKIILMGEKKQPQIRIRGLNKIRIPIVDAETKKEIAENSKSILEINKELAMFGEKSTIKTKQLLEKIDILKTQIDKIVYAAFKVSGIDIELIENSISKS